MKNFVNNTTKSLNVQRLINEALNILESVGISFGGKTEKALQSMAMSFLAVAGIRDSWSEAKNLEDSRNLTTREIIKFINEHYEENISPGSYDDIRRKHLSLLLLNGLVINSGKNPNASTSDPTRGYSLENKFKSLIITYGSDTWENNLKIFLENRKPVVNPAEIHNQVFDFLAEWSDSISASSTENKFFYIRSREDERFNKGYWFLGDENYLAISFWHGGDALNKTPNIYIAVNFRSGIDAYLVARDSENKKEYFEKLAGHLEGYNSNKDKTVWKKVLSVAVDNNLFRVIYDFIQTDKIIIDNFLLSTLQNSDGSDIKLLEDEFSSSFGFIEEQQFYQLRSRVESRKTKTESITQDDLPERKDLPIAIVSISIEKFQGIEKTSLEEELSTSAQWIFLTGENGFGKTSVLQAIALGLTNYDENREYIKDKSKIDIRYKKGKDIIINSSTFSTTEDFKSLNKNFIGYGPSRLNSQASSSENQESRNSSNIYNLFNRDGLLKNINYLLKMSRLRDNYEYDNLRNAIIEVLDKRVVDISFDEEGEVKYYEADSEKNLLGINRLEHLATGFQSLINLVGDIIVRFSKEFPSMIYSEFEGVVVIDELENHLHPIFQKKLPSLLSTVFPKLQFVTSVHSPIPLLGTPSNSIILKVNRDAERGITIEKVIIDNVDTLNPNILFTSPIFGFSSIISSNLVDTSKLRTENTWDEVQKNNELDKELLSLYNSGKKNFIG